MSFYCRLFGHEFEYPKFQMREYEAPVGRYYSDQKGGYGAIVDDQGNILSDDYEEVRQFRQYIEIIYSQNLRCRKINNTRTCIRCFKKEV